MFTIPLHTITANNVVETHPHAFKAMVTLTIGPLERVVYAYGRTPDSAIANARIEARGVAGNVGTLENARALYLADWERNA